MTKVSIAGSTGSIGTQSLEVVRASGGRFEVAALGAKASLDTLVAQAEEFRPALVAIGDESLANELEQRLGRGIEVVAGPDALVAIGECGDVVVNGVVGFAGLPVTIAALGSGRRLALANKESLITAAPIVQAARATPGAAILPVDSEHCAIHQCLSNARADHLDDPDGRGASDVSRLVLTASGGPFRGRERSSLASVRVEEALAHPTWKMGPKISVDSSTLMNKGLEVIEAHELFGVDYDHIEVVVHPQSVVHSLVEFQDGASIGQLSLPDMRLPIGYALSYPERFEVAYGAIDWRLVERLEFFSPDRSTFTCLDLAYGAGRAGGSAPAWMNAANEVAVEAFLSGRIAWLEIADVVAATLGAHRPSPLVRIGDVLEADRAAREVAGKLVGELVP